MAMRNTLKLAAVGALILGAVAIAEEKEKHEKGDKGEVIESVMKKSMKGDNSLIKKVIRGAATDAEKKQLLDYVKQLDGTKPPVGDKADWDQRIKELIKASEDVVAKKDGAIADLKQAADCKGCHKAHKED